MELHTQGNPGAPALLLALPAGADGGSLREVLARLERRYFLLVFYCQAPAGPEEAAEWLESRLLEDFTGRIWGAYGLREGADTLLALLARGRVRIRTLVAEGAVRTPPPGGAACSGQVILWRNARDRAAKRALRSLGRRWPEARTLTLRKLRAGQDFLSVRPDLMARRLEKALGQAQLVRFSSVMDRGAGRLWTLLKRRPPQGLDARLAAGEPPVVDEAARTLIREGRGGPVRLWSHLVHLEPVSGTETIYTDQVELSAGLLSGPARLLTALSLRRDHRRWARELRADREKAWLD